MKKLKRSVIKEELVELTGDYTKAIILNQFIYWSERMKDIDEFLAEEKNRMNENNESMNIKKQHGWIYKNADELADETMLRLTSKTMRKHIAYLVKNNWIDQRNNPKYKWDRTLQYRVNIKTIQTDLYRLGYHLEAYPLKQSEIVNLSKGKKSKMEEDKRKNERRKKSSAIPEITTEITTDTKKTSSAELTERFEKLWKLYPRKQGKKDAKRHYKRAIKEGTTDKEIKDGIEAYLKDIKMNNTKKKFIMHGSAWFNQERWNDEYISESRNNESEDELDFDGLFDIIGG